MIDVNGRLHSTEKNVNVVAGANEILDDAKGKKQSVINQETDAALEDRYTKAETYNKTELNNMITTPNQEFVTVTATDQTTAVTDVLPATGSADTVYRVGSWNGTQYEEGVYSEYSWNGSAYVHLSTKTEVGEVFDISAYHATGGELAKYADLTAALDSNNGGGVPQSLQEGGMSVKFVRTSDNKYVQFRCMAQNFTTDVTQWQGVDTKTTVASRNLIESGAVYNSSGILNGRIKGMEVLQPISVVNGKAITASGGVIIERDLPTYSYGIYSVSSDKKYYFSGFSKNTSSSTLLIWAVHFADSSNNFLGTAIRVDLTPGQELICTDEYLAIPPSTAYIYVNAQTKYLDYFNIKNKDIAVTTISDNTFSLRSCGLDNSKMYDGEYRLSMGYVQNDSFLMVKYPVVPNEKVKFSISVLSSIDVSVPFLCYLKDDGTYINCSDDHTIVGEEVNILNKEVIVPNNCFFVEFNIPKVSFESANFERLNILNEFDNIIPDYKILTSVNTEVGKVVQNSQGHISERELSNLSYSRYSISSDKRYSLNGLYLGSITLWGVYFADNDGNVLGTDARVDIHTLDGALQFNNKELNIPSGATYAYVNFQNKYWNFTELKEILNSKPTELVSTNDDTDRTDDFLLSLNNNKICKLGKGIFYVNQVNMPDDTTIIGTGKSTKIILKGTDTTTYAIRLGARCTIKDVWIDGGDSLSYKGENNVSIDSIVMTGNRHGILLLGTGSNQNYAGGLVSGCEITNFTGGGITCDNTGTKTYSSLEVSDCWIRSCCAGINISYASEFNKFVNVGCYDCRYGCINNGGNNSFANCGFNSNSIGYYMNGDTDKCVRYNGTLITGTNMGHGVMANCIIDHNGKDNTDVGYAIVMKSISPGYQFSNLSIHFNKLYFSNSKCVSISNCKMGNSTGVEIHDMLQPLVINQIIGINHSTCLYPFEIYENGELITTFDSDGNGGNVYMRDCFKYNYRVTPQSLMST